MRYALLLRGINVGGKNKVGMNHLKADLMELGFSNVVSYINSGNLFFDSTEPEEVIRCRLKRYFDATYEFPIPFIIVLPITCVELTLPARSNSMAVFIETTPMRRTISGLLEISCGRSRMWRL